MVSRQGRCVAWAMGDVGGSMSGVVVDLGGGCPMAIEWRKDVDAALAEAGSAGRLLLLDFTAAPM